MDVSDKIKPVLQVGLTWTIIVGAKKQVVELAEEIFGQDALGNTLDDMRALEERANELSSTLYETDPNLPEKSNKIIEKFKTEMEDLCNKGYDIVLATCKALADTIGPTDTRYKRIKTIIADLESMVAEDPSARTAGALNIVARGRRSRFRVLSQS